MPTMAAVIVPAAAYGNHSLCMLQLGPGDNAALLDVRRGDRLWRPTPPVRCNRPVLYIVGTRSCSGRVTEQLALANPVEET
jgi:hypothetical protein